MSDPLADLIGGDSPAEDPLYENAVLLVRTDNRVSASYLQRELELSYYMASQYIERMEKDGVISEPDDLSGARTVIDPITPPATDPDVIDVPPKRPRGRPPKDGGRVNAKKVEGVIDNKSPDLRTEQVQKGVTASWLARVMRMDVNDVKARLAYVTPMTTGNRQAAYDIKVAMQHLVDPVSDVETFIRNMDPKSLPTQLTAAFWSAEKTRLQTLEMARQLWDTNTVLTGYAHIFRVLRDDTKLWVDTLDEADEMTDKQRAVVSQLVDGLLANVYKSLAKFTEENATRSQLQFLEERLEEVKVERDYGN